MSEESGQAWTLAEVMPAVVERIRRFGFLGRGASYGTEMEGKASADYVEEFLLGGQGLDPTADDAEKGREIVDWVRSQSAAQNWADLDEEDFEYALQRAFSSDEVPEKELGVVAASVGAFQRGSSPWLPLDIDAPWTGEVQIIKQNQRTQRWGTSWAVRAITTDWLLPGVLGSMVGWWDSDEPQFAAHQTVTIRGVIRKKGEWRGMKETSLGRVRPAGASRRKRAASAEF